MGYYLAVKGNEFSTHFSKYQGEWLLDYMARVCLVCKKLPNHLSKWLCYFVFLPAIKDNSYCSTSLPVFGVVSVLEFGHSVRLFHCLNLQFLNDVWYWASFHMVHLSNVYLLWSVQIFCPFFNQIVFLWSFQSSLCILDEFFTIYIFCKDIIPFCIWSSQSIDIDGYLNLEPALHSWDKSYLNGI